MQNWNLKLYLYTKELPLKPLQKFIVHLVLFLTLEKMCKLLQTYEHTQIKLLKIKDFFHTAWKLILLLEAPSLLEKGYFLWNKMFYIFVNGRKIFHQVTTKKWRLENIQNWKIAENKRTNIKYREQNTSCYKSHSRCMLSGKK